MGTDDKMLGTIFGLSSTRDGSIRYVGQTADDVEERLITVLKSAKYGRSGALYQWVRGELSDGFSIVSSVVRNNAVMNMDIYGVIDELKASGAVLIKSVIRKPRIDAVRAPVSAETRAKLAEKGRARTPPVTAKPTDQQRLGHRSTYLGVGHDGRTWVGQVCSERKSKPE